LLKKEATQQIAISLACTAIPKKMPTGLSEARQANIK
jgi:hypothetical protein